MSSIPGRYSGLADVPPVVVPAGGLVHTVRGSTMAFQNVYTIEATVGFSVPDLLP